ncbi:MAG: hypothetical protein M1834_005759 [Cirrosporium novae-zelandiae]|nr:MAG: hypothetical protein M1834_005759 [Cirrosporium novae-zelandiae]
MANINTIIQANIVIIRIASPVLTIQSISPGSILTIVPMNILIFKVTALGNTPITASLNNLTLKICTLNHLDKDAIANPVLVTAGHRLLAFHPATFQITSPFKTLKSNRQLGPTKP